MKISMIWCEDINHGIGIDNKLPWHVASEMQHFKNTTMNQILVCGEKTFCSWGNKPLKNRTNVILTLDKNYKPIENTLVFNTLDNLLDHFKNDHIYIVGGKTIYKLFYPLADELIISTLKKDYHCNLFMNFDLKDFNKVKTIDNDEFVVNYYERKK